MVKAVHTTNYKVFQQSIFLLIALFWILKGRDYCLLKEKTEYYKAKSWNKMLFQTYLRHFYLTTTTTTTDSAQLST